MIIKYFADDGKEFEDENECEEYERKLGIHRFNSQVRMFTHDAKPVEIGKSLNPVYYLEILTDEAAKQFADYYSEEFLPWDYEGDVKAGRWYYNDYNDCWNSVAELLDKAEHVRKIFEN